MENLLRLRVLDDAGRAYTRAASRTVWLSLALSTTGSLSCFFARDVRTLDSGIYSSCPVCLAVHCSVSVCRLRSTGFWILLGEDLQKMSVFLCNAWFDSGYMFIRQSPEAVCHFLRESGLGS